VPLARRQGGRGNTPSQFFTLVQLGDGVTRNLAETLFSPDSMASSEIFLEMFGGGGPTDLGAQKGGGAGHDLWRHSLGFTKALFKPFQVKKKAAGKEQANKSQKNRQGEA